MGEDHRDALGSIGCQKWFDYEAQGLIPFFTPPALIFQMYALFGSRARNVPFLCTVTIIPIMRDGWAASAGGVPAMVRNVAFLMNDVLFLAASVYLLKQNLAKWISIVAIAR